MAATADKAAFEAWQNREIDMDECIHRFRANNSIPEEKRIDPVLFELWMGGLGFKRR